MSVCSLGCEGLDTDDPCDEGNFKRFRDTLLQNAAPDRVALRSAKTPLKSKLLDIWKRYGGNQEIRSDSPFNCPCNVTPYVLPDEKGKDWMLPGLDKSLSILSQLPKSPALERALTVSNEFLFFSAFSLCRGK